MLAKVILLALIKNASSANVTAYFLSENERLVYSYIFEKWNYTGYNYDLREMLRLQQLVPIFVELDTSNDTGIINTLDEQNTVIKPKMSVQTALIFGQKLELPLFIDQKTLMQKGILVTKKFIAEILQC